MSIFAKLFNRSHPSNPSEDLLYMMGGGMGSYTGKTISEQGALSATAVFAAVRLLSEIVASVN